MKNNLKLESMTSNASTTIEEGLDCILNHFQGQRLWPRTISTKTTEGRQVVVNSRKEALARFVQANLLDCRISAYPLPSELSSFVGVNLEIAPSVVMIDLDRETFKTQKAFEMALTKTLRKIRETIISEPTVIWSGSGYHIYLVLDAIVLEGEDVFNNNKFGSNPSQKFLRFAEWFLSNGKCDPQHNKTVSFKNCMLRIPGSINSKNRQTVEIIRKWNGFSPNIRFLLGSFHAWLIDKRLKEFQTKKEISKKTFPNMDKNIIPWIERLLKTPVADYRKLAIWRIFAPYLTNIRGLSPDEAYCIIHEWLDECDKLRRLDFTPSYKTKGALSGTRDFLPVSRKNLKVKNEEFYNLLKDNGVLS